MALDVFVMPIWKFKIGDFKTAAEQISGLGRVHYVGGKPSRPGNPLTRWYHVRRAKASADLIRQTVSAASKRAISWSEEGGCVYSEQAHNMDALQAYAMWLNHRDELPEFVAPTDMDFRQHPVLQTKLREVDKSSHLISHSLFNGYFLPARFEDVVPAEPYLMFGVQEAFRDAGSSYKLAEELEVIRNACGMPTDEEFDWDDHMSYVRDGLAQLREITELSLRHHLPIIFWS